MTSKSPLAVVLQRLLLAGALLRLPTDPKHSASSHGDFHPPARNGQSMAQIYCQFTGW